jgi:hypothetical protein
MKHISLFPLWAALAQAQGTASLYGTVTDAAGGVVPDAQVKTALRNLAESGDLRSGLDHRE